MRGETIGATLKHDAGAVARCSSCGRYTDEGRALTSRIECSCGEECWTGSFVPPTESSEWSTHFEKPATPTMVTPEEIDAVWGNSDFGATSRIDVVRYGALKCAVGYHQGSTSKAIITELGLITPEYKITERGRRCLWEWFGKNLV